MPQLDTYITSQIIINSSILWLILLLININIILINLYLSLTIKFIHVFINKFFLSSFFREVIIRKKLKYIKKMYKIILNWFIFFNKIIFETELLSIKNINNLLIEKFNFKKKNNLWLLLNINIKRNQLLRKWH